MSVIINTGFLVHVLDQALLKRCRFLACITSFGNKVHRCIVPGMRNCFLPINCFELRSCSLHLMPPKSCTESGQIDTEYILSLTCRFIIQYCTVLLQFFPISLHLCLSKEHSVICKLSHLAAVSWLGVMNRGTLLMSHLHCKNWLFTLWFVSACKIPPIHFCVGLSSNSQST